MLADVTEISPGLFEIGDAEWSRMTVTSGGDPVAAIPLITGKKVYIHQPGEEPTAFERMRAAKHAGQGVRGARGADDHRRPEHSA
jgi:hypothetical protein